MFLTMYGGSMDYNELVYGHGLEVHKWSTREVEFYHFSMVVQGHIDRYTIPQYGDAPTDQVEEWTPSQCMDSVKRYASRINSNARGRLETLRDMAKIAHFAAMAFYKLKPTAVEIIKVKEGRT